MKWNGDLLETIDTGFDWTRLDEIGKKSVELPKDFVGLFLLLSLILSDYLFSFQVDSFKT